MKARIPFLVLSVLTILTLSTFPAPAAAETVAGLPLHVQQLDPGVIRVWIGDHISSTATVAVATEKGLVIIDTTGNPLVDRELRRIIARELDRDDFAVLIDTHEHLDHTGGNAVYADCSIVGHELVAAGMERSLADRPRIIEWMTTRVAELEQQVAALAADAPESPKLREDLISNRLELEVLQANEPLVMPTRTFADRLVLDMGDVTFELSYIGGMHSASDVAVLIPEHGLLLTGDTMADVWLTETPGCLASFSARQGVRHDFPLLLKNWNALLARRDEIRLLVPGHWNGELTFAGFEARVKYVEALWDGARKAAQAGGTVETVMADYALQARFPALVDSPGCDGRGNSATIQEIWTEATGQRSAAQALYELIEAGAEDAAIAAVVDGRAAEDPPYFYIESQINGWGYRFLQQGMAAQAVRLFRANRELFPDSWNAYDSLAEALLATGDEPGAVAMYEKSVALNPENTNGQEALARIRGATSVN